MRGHLTDTLKTQVKQTDLELAIIPGGLTKELEPPDIGVNRSFKFDCKLHGSIWRQKANTGWTSYATICQWILDVWAKVSVSSVVPAFTKAGIINEQLSNSNETGWMTVTTEQCLELLKLLSYWMPWKSDCFASLNAPYNLVRLMYENRLVHW